MATRYAKETGRNWSRWDRPSTTQDTLIPLARMRRVPRASVAFDHYTAHRARCFRPVRLPRGVEVVSCPPLREVA